jgi:hypothetical protein
MTIFDWLFGRKITPPGKSQISAAERTKPPRTTKGSGGGLTLEIRDIGSDMLTIPALDFFGPYRRSPNGRFRLAWRDGDGNRGGARDHGKGHYVLIDRDRVVARGRMERPNDGKVADNGNFILNDWGFTTELSGTFRAFRGDGSPILAQSFAANLFNNGLSTDGALAACQTCGSASESDSTVLAIFDLARGVERARFRAESGWADTYQFAGDQQVIQLGYSNGGGEFAYTLDGAFVDRDKWISTRLEQGDLYMVRTLLNEAGGKPDDALAARLLAAIDRGLAHHTQRDERSQASGWRLRGEVLEARASTVEAIACYEKAVGFDPKVGVKRRLDQLKRGQPTQ